MTTEEVRAVPCSIPESHLCPMQPGIPSLVPPAMAGMTIRMCTAQQGWIKLCVVVFRGFCSPCLASENI